MTRETDANVGRRVASARLRRGMSQGTLGRLAGLDPSYISRIETGKVQPTYRTLKRVADALRAPLSELGETPLDSQAATRKRCPVSGSGICLLELIRPEGGGPALRQSETFTPRQIKILRNFAAFLRTTDRERMRAMELLLEDVTRARQALGLDSTEPRS